MFQYGIYLNFKYLYCINLFFIYKVTLKLQKTSFLSSSKTQDPMTNIIARKSNEGSSYTHPLISMESSWVNGIV